MPRIRIALRILVLAACVGLGWLVVTRTVGALMARSDPEAALAWRPGSEDARMGVVENLLKAESPEQHKDEIQRLAGQAIRSNPISARALRAIALTSDLDGDPRRASEVMQTLNSRTRRDAAAQIWLFNQGLADGRFQDAAKHADAILRTHSDLTDDVIAALSAFTSDPDGIDALTEVLARSPPWRARFLEALTRERIDDSATVFEVYAALADSPHPPTDVELGYFLNRLIAQEQYQLAYLTWLHFLFESPSAGVAYAHNGAFEKPLTGLPFDWLISQVRGATTEVISRGPDDRALQVVFADTRVRYRHVRKMLVLPPGRYKLSGLERAERLENERGMVWEIVCADNASEVLGQSKPLSGSVPWTAFDFGFEVPQSGCAAQWLQLRLPARTRLETQIGGAVFYDDIKIERMTNRG
ncbi:MAG: hypothetical protein GY798_12900 [Hyphomicrobiales bacterium]|nr:hypothetical protein [Hyphomicrobiales bacterium]